MESKTVGQLRKIASKMGLKDYLRLKKADLIEFIEEAVELQKQGRESLNLSELKNKTNKQLRKIACEMGLKEYSRLKKYDLIKFIEEGVEAQNQGEKFSFNDECPICLSDDGIFHLMSCKHKIHLGCAKGMYSSNCPICRSEVENFPSYIYKKIKENSQPSLSYNHRVMDDGRILYFPIFIRIY